MNRKHSEPRVFRQKPKALKALGLRPGDWEYLTNVAAKARGDIWIRLLLGANGRAA